MQAALAELGEPNLEYPVLHVGGTNGKGSVAAMAAWVLRAGGRRVGLYTSPHLCSFDERILLNGAPVPESRLQQYADELRGPLARNRLTFFEAATLLAFQTFARERVDVAVFEVGLGGRLDATKRCPTCRDGRYQRGTRSHGVPRAHARLDRSRKSRYRQARNPALDRRARCRRDPGHGRRVFGAGRPVRGCRRRSADRRAHHAGGDGTCARHEALGRAEPDDPARGSAPGHQRGARRRGAGGTSERTAPGGGCVGAGHCRGALGGSQPSEARCGRDVALRRRA